jgi:hypothetical protein
MPLCRRIPMQSGRVQRPDRRSRGTDAGFIRSATPPGSTCCHTPEHLPPLNQQPKRTTKQTWRRSLRKKPRPCRGPGQPTPDGGIKARSSQWRPGRSFPASTAPRPTTTSRPVMPYRLDSAGQAKSTDGITLSEREGRGARAQCRRYGRRSGRQGGRPLSRRTGRSVCGKDHLPSRSYC